MGLFALTLKNLYRLLTVNDYPVYSNGILPAKDRKGITLVSFWSEHLITEWKSGTYGRSLWLSDPQKRRYLSEFCNRKEGYPFYAEYEKEIITALTRESVLDQVHIFSEFLTARHYSHKVFMKKASYVLRECLLKDKQEEPVAQFLAASYLQNDTGCPDVFADAWFLTLAALFAMTGTQENEREVLDLCIKQALDLRSIQALSRKASAQSDLALLHRNGEVWGCAESSVMFFGREKELFNLVEAVHARAKVFLTGIGGIGKTELLRQLLHRFLETSDYRNILSVQYEDSLRESLVRCFLNLSGDSLESRFQECLFLMEQVPKESLIILIDNASVSEDEKSDWQALAELDCAVIVTSREQAPEGFTQFGIGMLSEPAALLMMRRHYTTHLSDEQQEKLSAVISRHALQHPLTIRLIARAAAWNGWSVEEIGSNLQDKLETVRWKDARVQQQLSAIYRNLYRRSGLDREERQFVDMLAALPYEQYGMQQLSDFCHAGMGTEDCGKYLDDLSRKGWLEKKASAYSIHPLIAECVRESGMDPAVFRNFFAYVKKMIHADGLPVWSRTSADAETLNLCRYAVHVYRALREQTDEASMQAVIEAVYLCTTFSPFDMRILDIAEAYAGNYQNAPLMIRFLTDLCRTMRKPIHAFDELLDAFMTYCDIKEIPEMQIVEYGSCLINDMTNGNRQEETLQRIREKTLERAVSEKARVRFLFIIQKSYMDRFLLQESIRMADEVYTLYQSLPETEASAVAWDVRASLLIRSQTELMLSDPESARVHYRQAMAMENAAENLTSLFMRLTCEIFFARYDQQYELAVQKMDEMLLECRKYMGTRDADYLVQTGEKATLLNMLGRSEEALELHRQNIEVSRRYHILEARQSLWLNNEGVTLLSLKRPEEAIRVLKESIALESNEAGIPWAEPTCNLSKAYRQTGDTENEKACLVRVLPIFESAYGKEHPKTQYVAQRLEELSRS